MSYNSNITEKWLILGSSKFINSQILILLKFLAQKITANNSLKMPSLCIKVALQIS